VADTSTVEQDYRLWVLLQQASNILFEARENELREHGFTAMHAAALLVIKSIGDKATPAQISRWMVRKPHSISGLLARMERIGLIRKTKDLHKKNLVRVSITEKGEAAYKHAVKRKMIQKVMSSLTAEQRKQLTTSLELLRTKGLKEMGIDPKKLPFQSFA
jgi:DNA-binding MarR family transcriptional regulator